MKVKCSGKVLARSHHAIKSGELYTITIEEPGLYPNVFQFSSKNASLFGQPDGPCGVGKNVTAEGFANGSARDAQRKDGTSFKAYSVYFTLTKLEGIGRLPAAGATAPEGEPDDMPF